MESDDPLGESKASESDVLATCPTNRELGTKPVGRLFAKYAGITLIGFTFQAIMVICEGLITGNGLGAYGLAVVAVIMPLELLNLALSTALGMGTATLVGQHFGANDNAGARRMFAQGMHCRLGRSGGNGLAVHQHLHFEPGRYWFCCLLRHLYRHVVFGISVLLLQQEDRAEGSPV